MLCRITGTWACGSGTSTIATTCSAEGRLKEGTFVADHLFLPGILARAEYRRDFSNQRFFLTDTVGPLSKAQDTATLGLMCWWGTKQGNW
jgi:hypothetical protein